MPFAVNRAHSGAVMFMVRTVRRAPFGMASRAFTAKFTITCSNCEMSTLTSHKSRPGTTSSLTLSPIRRRKSIVRSFKTSPISSTCGRSVCLREKANNCRTRLAARLAFCLICMMSPNDGSVGLCALRRKSVGFLIAFFFLDRRHIKPAEALAAPDQHRIDRGDVGLAERRLPDGRLQSLAVAFGDRGDDGALLGFAAGAVEQAREQRIGAHHSAMLVDGSDRHWRVMEEANEPDLGGALRIAPGLARAIEHEAA